MVFSDRLMTSAAAMMLSLEISVLGPRFFAGRPACDGSTDDAISRAIVQREDFSISPALSIPKGWAHLSFLWPIAFECIGCNVFVLIGNEQREG